MKKCEVICLVSFFHSSVMVLILPKTVHFLQICTDLSKKSKSVTAIYLCPPERPYHVLSEYSRFIGVRATVQEILRNKMSKMC